MKKFFLSFSFVFFSGCFCAENMILQSPPEAQETTIEVFNNIVINNEIHKTITTQNFSIRFRINQNSMQNTCSYIYIGNVIVATILGSEFLQEKTENCENIFWAPESVELVFIHDHFSNNTTRRPYLYRGNPIENQEKLNIRIQIYNDVSLCRTFIPTTPPETPPEVTIPAREMLVRLIERR